MKAAPWPSLLKAISALSTLLLLGVSYAAARVIPPASVPAAHLAGTLAAWIPLSVGLGALPFVVRSYEIDASHLRVERLLWRTEVPLEGLRRAWHEPGVLKGSLRVFGNGGLYSFTGVFWSKRLGRYRMFVTDPKRAVVLVLPSRVVVVSPESPEAFLQQLRALYPGAEGEPPAGQSVRTS